MQNIKFDYGYLLPIRCTLYQTNCQFALKRARLKQNIRKIHKHPNPDYNEH